MFPDRYFVYWQHYIDLFRGIYGKFNSLKCEDLGPMTLQKDCTFYKDAVDWIARATMHHCDLQAAQHPFNVISLGCASVPLLYAFPGACPGLRVKHEPGESDAACPHAVNFIELCNQSLGVGMKTGTVRLNKMSWHDKEGGDDHPQKAAFETAVVKSLEPFLSSAPKYVSETHRVLFLYPCRGTNNDFVEVSVRVEWSNNPNSAERVEARKIDDAFACFAEEIGAYCGKAGLHNSKKKQADAEIKDSGPDFFVFTVRLPLWNALPRNKNMRRDLLDHRSVIMICNITVDQSVEILKFLLSIQWKPIPGGLFVTPVFDKFKRHDGLGIIELDGGAPCAVWAQYDSAETQEIVKTCINMKVALIGAEDVLSNVFFVSFGPANNHILPVTKRILGCPEHFRCNTSYQHNPWHCIFSQSPCTARLKGLIHGCSNRDHFSRNKGWVNFKDSIEEILRRGKINFNRERANVLLHDIADVFMNVNDGQNRQSFQNMSCTSALEDYLGPDSKRCNFLFGPLLYIGKLFAAVNPPQAGVISSSLLATSASVPPYQQTQAGIISSSSPAMYASVPPPPPPYQQTQARKGAEGARGNPPKRQKTLQWCCSHCGHFNDGDFQVVRGHEEQCSFKPPQHLFGVHGV